MKSTYFFLLCGFLFIPFTIRMRRNFIYNLYIGLNPLKLPGNFLFIDAIAREGLYRIWFLLHVVYGKFNFNYLFHCCQRLISYATYVFTLCFILLFSFLTDFVFVWFLFPFPYSFSFFLWFLSFAHLLFFIL